MLLPRVDRIVPGVDKTRPDGPVTAADGSIVLHPHLETSFGRRGAVARQEDTTWRP
jgi:hypothetical protein